MLCGSDEGGILPSERPGTDIRLSAWVVGGGERQMQKRAITKLRSLPAIWKLKDCLRSVFRAKF